MFIAQLAEFLALHHHAHQAALLTADPARVFYHWYAWAAGKGFAFRP